jgi:nitrite reductase (NO-forming)
VIGGGPVAVRVGMAVIEVAWPARLALRHLSLVLIGAVRAPAGVEALWWGLVLATYALDLVLLVLAARRQRRARQAPAPAGRDRGEVG